MPSAFLLTVPGSRDGSGTSWLPDTSPMHAWHGQCGKWGLMLHGNVFVRFTYQDVTNSGERGKQQFSAPNWIMMSAQRRVGARGQFMLRGMFSLDRLTEGGDGYPLLFQTGESWKGDPLVDQQHPHDLFAELAAGYSHAVGKQGGVYLYFGMPGEPALGPPVFMHRPSAQNNPEAPLGHHWQDATHITFGVATLGVQYRYCKLEGSWFTGREPDEKRYGFDAPHLDSYSVRLSVNPSAHAALQFSHGWLAGPEAMEPGVDVNRTTASLISVYPFARENSWAATLAWGMNKPEFDESQHSFLLESDLQINHQAFFTRLEWVEKPAQDLNVIQLEERLLLVRAFTLGAAQKLFSVGGLSLAAGVQGTLNVVDESLQVFYGERPVSVGVFLRLFPGLQTVKEHGTEKR